jgi:hypothetical protein
MKLIQSNNETVTVELSHEELRDLHDALADAIDSLDHQPGILNDLIEECAGLDDPDEVRDRLLDADRPEMTVEQLKKSLARAERLLPKVHDLSEGLWRII